jgi:hypothetical protein
MEGAVTGDLAAFLAARLDEDEAAARESYYEGQRWLTEEEGVYRWPDDEPVHLADRKADARHIARHGPARALREVAAKRALLTGHEGVHRCDWGEHRGPGVLGGWCKTVRTLAAVYSDHPDYLQEWAP